MDRQDFFKVRSHHGNKNGKLFSSSSSSSSASASTSREGGFRNSDFDGLESLGVTLRNQDDVENSVINQLESKIEAELQQREKGWKPEKDIRVDTLTDIINRSNVESVLKEKVVIPEYVKQSKKQVLETLLAQAQGRLRFLPKPGIIKSSSFDQINKYDEYMIKIQVLSCMLEAIREKENRVRNEKNVVGNETTSASKSSRSGKSRKRVTFSSDANSNSKSLQNKNNDGEDGEIVETAEMRRDRLIRTGVITPFHKDTPEKERQAAERRRKADPFSPGYQPKQPKSLKKKSSDPFKPQTGKKRKIDPFKQKADKGKSKSREGKKTISVSKEKKKKKKTSISKIKVVGKFAPASTKSDEKKSVKDSKRKSSHKEVKSKLKAKKVKVVDDEGYLPDNMGQCPICNRLVSLDKIQDHVEKCLTRPRTLDHGEVQVLDEEPAFVDLTSDCEGEEKADRNTLKKDIPGIKVEADIPGIKVEAEDDDDDDDDDDDYEEEDGNVETSDIDVDEEDVIDKKKRRKVKKEPKKRKEKKVVVKKKRLKNFVIPDDSNLNGYKKRLKKYMEQEKHFSSRLKEMKDQGMEEEEAAKKIIEEMNDMEIEEERMEVEEKEENDHGVFSDSDESDDGGDILRSSDIEMFSMNDDFKLPKRLYYTLFPYQRTGVKWLWELHNQNTGGILGDEQGLGKTCQMCSFLAGLKCSKALRPSVIVCPATTLSLWVNQLNKWYAPLRIWVLHSSSAGKTLEGLTSSEIVLNCVQRGDIILTTYQGLRMCRDQFLGMSWGYVILDEGHKLKNPDADITMLCKQLQTVHRIVMSGTPIQNNLKELWSLFDFVYPGRLGTLPMFESQFALPINSGGYANASNLQVQMAYRCAMVLKESIQPYLLRRLKKDVATQLPQKTEQVLFCNLTDEQRAVYREFLDRPEVDDVINGSKYSKFRDRNRSISFGLIRTLQHICNHPDLYHKKMELKDVESDDKPRKGKGKGKARIMNIGDIDSLVKRSGKLLVLRIVMRKWFEQGHRVLLFSQSRLMLDILETFITAEGYTYLRMDGTTNIKARGPLIDKFNKSDDIFVFVLTTRVGGVGINLMGANRVVLYDPDWNPSTDSQARERAWRVGQKKQVTIYRLITNGTIEEKMYHRQIFKSYLTNKVLSDPRQRRFFSYSSMRDLFTLGDTGEDAGVYGDKMDGTLSRSKSMGNEHTETSNLFSSAAIRQEEYQNKESEHDNDNSILSSLLHGGEDARRVFRQAFSHDTVEGATKFDPDHRILSEEASRVAREASEALQREQQQLQRNSDQIHVPTWTGQNGDFGRRFGGEGSSSLLARMRQRQQGSVMSNSSSSTNNNGESGTSGAVSALKELRSMLGEGPKSTSAILSRFRTKGIDPRTFREMMREISDCNGGMWYLKDKYK